MKKKLLALALTFISALTFAEEMKKVIFITFILIFSVMNYSCKDKKSTLTIKNWPFKGSGKMTISVYENTEYIEDTEDTKTNIDLDLDSDKLKKMREDGSLDEAVEYLGNAIAKALASSIKNAPKAIRVAKCLSLSLSSPFKLVSDDGMSDWDGNGTYTVKIYVPDNSIRSIIKKDVVFTNGSATIDYNSMEINYTTQKE